MRFKPIQPHEIVRWLGLMIVHALSPTKPMEMHWSTKSRGVIPSGTFGAVMGRDPFREISRFLHLSDNGAADDRRDRAWKIRPILSTLETTFKDGCTLGSVVSLDEGMLPSHNRRNPTNVPERQTHKWGSKCVLTCCTVSGYCKRVEVDVGRKKTDTSESIDTKSGPAAVILDIACVFRGQAYEGRLLVVTDRYYTSIPLAQQLRTMGFNFYGTIQKGRKGWCKGIEYSFKKRPRDFLRGEFKMAVAADNPVMIALGWVNNKRVYVLAAQVPTELTNVTRREKNGALTMVPCPTVTAKDFTRTTAREAAPSIASRPMSVTHEHVLVQSVDTRVNSGVERVRQRQCKVCSIYKPSHKKRGGTSSYYYPQCSEGKRELVTLCNKVRNYVENEGLTCGQIWHITCRNGVLLRK
ncbi:hypothetical protein ON010_g9305 [Phytophthora cinnamomi]|nr:hypothetical protein ON010_g9305 [Phytophthora cinnamomi]